MKRVAWEAGDGLEPTLLTLELYFLSKVLIP